MDKKTPIDAIMGTGVPRGCKRFSKDVSIHWYPSFEEGIKCFCGEVTRKDETEEKPAP